ncbi:hypothetical protein [Paenibacillus piscarius]|uniref:hypothetical protein n=1 Tax=Paenibacillus piscarius TaxID=1089681 RepID=UPI001EE7E454|nr:hypothetical protein [Paenibacillus piscarius]
MENNEAKENKKILEEDTIEGQYICELDTLCCYSEPSCKRKVVWFDGEIVYNKCAPC